MALADHGGRNLKRSVERALRDAERHLRKVERDRSRYEAEDYRRERGKALLWIRLYTLLLRRLEALEKGEGVRLVRGRVDVKAVDTVDAGAVFDGTLLVGPM